MVEEKGREARRLKISVSSSCYNEEGNLREWYERIVAVFRNMPQYDYEIVIADNCSTDNSRNVLRQIAAEDRNFKVIFNANNFGQIRSPLNAFLQCTGDAVVMMVSDLQEPPEVIPELVKKWEQGYDVVVATKSHSKENILMATIRKGYYWLLSWLSDTGPLIRNFTGFGLYSRRFIESFKKYHDPYPYFRGLVSEIGFPRAEVQYVQQKRKYGKTKNNLFTLYAYAMNGFVNHSKLPLRLIGFAGFCLATFSMVVALVYFIYKLLYWETFSLGLAPLVIGFFFLSAMQMIFIGIIGEYVGAILTQVKNYPLAIEEERLNFDDKDKKDNR